MNITDFDYHLPAELIAQQPTFNRTASRMLVLRRETGECTIHDFTAILDFLTADDCLVLNDTRVIPARLIGQRAGSGGRIELLMCEEISPGRWRTLIKPSRRIKPATVITLGQPPVAALTVEKRNPDNSFNVLADRPDVLELITQHGEIPLPPYIRRNAVATDETRYQTVYAKNPGAVAAPTAGLHFNLDILNEIKNRQITVANLTLHVGPGTFQPVKTERIEDHEMHEERYHLTPENADLINQVKARQGRVIAVGTTSVRVLETCVDENGEVKPGEGKTSLFIHPPMKPRIVDALLTNFHLPRSTLMMLVTTFTGRRKLLEAYQLAIEHKMRFYSYGDCMLIV